MLAGVVHSMEQGWGGMERRSFPRTGLSLPVNLTVVSTDDPSLELNGSIDGVTRDVSRGGCAIVTDRDLGERTRCIARFSSTTGNLNPDTVWAEVRRSTSQPAGYVIGLEFETPLDGLHIATMTGDASTATADQRHRILVVDDQDGIRTLLARHLDKRGFDVQTAANGEEAFQAILHDPPDALLLDLYLPLLNGHDLLRRLRDMQMSVNLIYTMSAYADTVDAQECLRLGAADHLLKPIDLDYLVRGLKLRLGALAKRVEGGR